MQKEHECPLAQAIGIRTRKNLQLLNYPASALLAVGFQSQQCATQALPPSLLLPGKGGKLRRQQHRPTHTSSWAAFSRRKGGCGQFQAGFHIPNHCKTRQLKLIVCVFFERTLLDETKRKPKPMSGVPIPILRETRFQLRARHIGTRPSSIPSIFRAVVPPSTCCASHWLPGV